MSLAFIGIGSNLNNPQQQAEQALLSLSEIPQCRVIQHSSWYQNRAIGPGEQPDFINGVAALNTQLEPHALLDQLQAIEHQQKRVRGVHWGPRTIDLDLLLYDQMCIDTARLQVPHPFLTQRDFVLYPLAELQPELILPCGTAIATLLKHQPNNLIKLVSPALGATSD